MAVCCSWYRYQISTDPYRLFPFFTWVERGTERARCLSQEHNQSGLRPRGEQGWRSGESTRLPLMWPGFDSRTRRHMWVEFVVGSHPCSEGFSPGSPVFLSPQKATFLNSNSIRNSRPHKLLALNTTVPKQRVFFSDHSIRSSAHKPFGLCFPRFSSFRLFNQSVFLVLSNFGLHS